MNRPGVILIALAGLGCLAGAGLWNERLLDLRRADNITQADPLENAPPLVSFTTIALGGFRGIIADMLWLRSSQLQQEGRYFELVQLADWITKLEPRFPQVWAYHAWNLAYNISVMFQDPDDRWRWVRHGIDLLRSEGLRYNPDDPRLLLELGWLYQHKIGGTLDDAHRTYKRRLADEVEALLGGGRPDYEAWAALPEDRDALRNLPGAQDLLRQLRERGLDPWDALALAQADLGDLTLHPAWPVVRDMARRDTFLRIYRLDPATMQALEEQFGQQDWRIATAHSLYWAREAAGVARTTFDEVSADRMTLQSLQETFRRGRLVRDDSSDLLLFSPNLAVLPHVLRTYREVIEAGASPTAEQAYRNFLLDAVFVLYTYRQMDRARELLADLRRLDPTLDDGRSVDDLVLEMYAGAAGQLSVEEAVAIIEGALVQSLAMRRVGEAERAAGLERLAVRIWNRYMQERMANPAFRERTGLPPLEQLRNTAEQRLAAELQGARDGG